jgi:hypothetical protein
MQEIAGLERPTMTTQKKARMVAVNEKGQRIGEDHPRAVLTDHEVDLLLELKAEGYSLAWLAAKFEISRVHAWRIVTGRKRAQTPARFKRNPGR